MTRLFIAITFALSFSALMARAGDEPNVNVHLKDGRVLPARKAEKKAGKLRVGRVNGVVEYLDLDQVDKLEDSDEVKRARQDARRKQAVAKLHTECQRLLDENLGLRQKIAELKAHLAEARKQIRDLQHRLARGYSSAVRTPRESRADTVKIDESKIPTPVGRRVMVHVTRTGKRYHRAGCRHAKAGWAVPLKEAQGRGLTPCQVCHPPTEDKTE